MKHCIAAFAATFALGVSLTGCDSDSTPDSAPANHANSTSNDAHENAASAPAADKGKAAMSSSAINLDAAFGRVAPVVTEVGACPFLSDEGALSSVKTSYELTRREVSNSVCRWSYNAGFSLVVTVEPVDKALPVEQRRYNLGVDTQIDSQPGPGNNAVLVSDTAWGRPIPFGYGFEIDGSAVFVRVTGMKTDQARLSATAQEIANLLPNAPAIEQQQRTETAPFSPCSVWSKDDIQNVMAPLKFSPFSSHASGNSCIYEAYGEANGSSLQLTVRFGELDAKYHAKAIERGDEDVSGFEFPVSASVEPSDFGTYTKLTGYVDGGAIELLVLDKANATHRDVTEQLLRNLASRFEQ